ncbi:MAG: PCRF domain-containing protein, partial [Lachnospiraceae bacterium]|nr:PCRF domain-containing protein [Lachnospiraceae bacterium]
MFEQCADVCKHYEEIQAELSSPDVAADQNRFRRLMKEQSDLAPLVEAYRAYVSAGRDKE